MAQDGSVRLTVDVRAIAPSRGAPRFTDKEDSMAANRKKRSAKKTSRRVTPEAARASTAASDVPPQLRDFLDNPAAPKGFVASKKLSLTDLRKRLLELDVRPTVPLEQLLPALNRIKQAPGPKLREEVRASIRALKPEARRFHGTKIDLSWFPFPFVTSPCADMFGYMSSVAVRNSTKLPFNPATELLLGELGNLMGDASREPNAPSNNPADAGVSTIPAGFTYFGQFVDHDVTFDVSSSIDTPQDANTINNMRTPALDLDSVYGRGPGLDPFLYVFPSSGPPTAIKFQTGTNLNNGPGGPSNNGAGTGMLTQTRFDVPRVAISNTAVIGDPRNDENLVVVQFHHAMLRFHNAVVDMLVAINFANDIFAEAKRIVTHHYQWAVVHDFLGRICGAPVVATAMSNVVALPGSPFRMPVEFAVAAYRFGHSMIRDFYWVNFNFINATLGQVFEFNRNPNLPVRSNWVVDFNAFFDTGVPVPVHNKARRIDSFLAHGLETLPGFSGLMAILATRNLRRGLAFGLPSGQGMANAFSLTPMTTAQLTQGLLADELAVLNKNGGLLLKRTPLWYYVLREAAVLGGGNQLGPVGGRIVAETFVRMLKRDASSYLNVTGGFTPILPSATPGDFTVADLIAFSGVNKP